MGGFGSAVLEALSAAEVVIPTRCLAVPDELIEHGSTPESVGIGSADIALAVAALLSGR